MKLVKRKGINSLLNNRILAAICLLFSTVGSAAYGYGTSPDGGEHADITNKAITNYINWGLEDLDNHVGVDALISYFFKGIIK